MTAEAGAVTAIVGPNGSGKTTLLRALTGEIRATGRVTLNGRDLARLRPWERAAAQAVLPQAGPVAFPFTVAEVVALGHTAGAAAGQPEVPDRALA
ncbi:MAG: ATP-binding cassette domain-containing protein, partial [Alphaproteobacteria bacterium]|nr:ATP-binding cassette domain-containing protein [Alphaproteobacteria bacterium]